MPSAEGEAVALNLDPGIKAYIELADQLYDDEAEHGSLEDQRQAYLDLCGAFARPHPEGVKAMGRTFRADRIDIPVRVYRPAGGGAPPPIPLFPRGGRGLGGVRNPPQPTSRHLRKDL